MMQSSKRWVAGWTAGGLAAVLGLAGCELGSPDKAVRLVGIQVAGLYRNPDGRLVQQTSGGVVLHLDLRQMGDRLTGIDNHGNVFEGRLSELSPTRVSVQLEGTTTGGGEALITGEIQVTGNTAVLRGTWIEPTLYSTVYGQAQVGGVVSTNGPPATNNLDNVTLDPAP